MITTGETPANQINKAAATGIIAVFHVILADLAIFHNGAAISATTAGRMPLNMRSMN